jgi:hypothetical protein
MSGAVSLHMRVNMSGRNPYPLELNLVLKKRERAQYATVSRELRSNAFAWNPRHEGILGGRRAGQREHQQEQAVNQARADIGR